MTKALIRGSLFFFAFRFLAFAATLSAADQPAPAPPGKLVDVGGRKLHLYCTGPGSPTVVLEAGAGGFSIDWALVEAEIANTTRVCSYDRAGYGWSDPGPEWDTVEQVAHDLETALKNEREHSPYVLVGQSMGGLFVRWYQHEHPEQVVGMVLVDTYEPGIGINGQRVDLHEVTKEQLQANLPPPSSYTSLHSQPTCAPRFNKLPEPLPTIHLWLERTFFETLEFNQGPAMMESWRSAYTILHQASLTPDSLAGLPLVVLTRENVIEDEPKQQTELARLSRNSRKEMAVGSGHFIQTERPDLVIEAIKSVMTKQYAAPHRP